MAFRKDDEIELLWTKVVTSAMSTTVTAGELAKARGITMRELNELYKDEDDAGLVGDDVSKIAEAFNEQADIGDEEIEHDEMEATPQ